MSKENKYQLIKTKSDLLKYDPSKKKDLIVRGLKDIELQKKILVVAAQDNIGELLSDILTKEGYFVSIVESWGIFEEVLFELKHEKYNMVLLTNNSLQPHYILSLVSEIKRQYPSLCVFVLSGYKAKDFIVDLKRQGIDEFLSMPFESDHLVSTIKRIFSDKSSRLKEKMYCYEKLKLAHKYIDIGKYQESLDLLNQIIRIRSDFADAHFALGIVFYTLNMDSEAKDAYDKAIKIKPDFAEAYMGLGLIYYDQGMYAKAVELYSQAIKIEPNDTTYLNLGLAYGDLGMYADTEIEMFIVHKDICFKIPDAGKGDINQNHLKNVLSKLTSKEEMVIRTKYGLKTDRPQPHTNEEIGRLLSIDGEMVKLIEAKALRKLRHRNNQKSQDLFNLALKAFNNALRLNPDFYEAYYNLGFYYGELKKYNEAIKALEKVIEMNPNFECGHFLLGQNYAYLQNKTKALGEYQWLKNVNDGLAEDLFEFVYQ